MPPAARVTDMHVCPMVTGIVPHVGGPILPPCAPTVLIGFLPAARVTDMLTCVGPPDIIIMGSTGVFIDFLPAARMGDPTAHGGVIVLGEPTVMIGEIGSPAPGAGGMGGIAAGLVAAAGDSQLGGGGLKAFLSKAAAAMGLPNALPPDWAPGGTQKKAVAEVNPTNSQKNCGYITNAVVDRIKGTDPSETAPDKGPVGVSFMEQRNNTHITFGKTLNEAFDAVKQGGNGTVAIVVILWPPPGSGGHVVALSNDGGVVGIVEGQDWGPGQPKEVITDVSAANQRYNPDGKSIIGYGLVP